MIHELGHVWQSQNGIKVWFSGLFDREYKYLPLVEGKAFRSYGIEQQGDILRDYFLVINGYGRNLPTRDAYEAILPFVKRKN